MVSDHYLLRILLLRIVFIFYTQVYNHRSSSILVNIDQFFLLFFFFGVMALFQLNFCLKIISVCCLLKNH